jgi:hypothetical protein
VASGKVKQSKQHTRRTDPKKFVEVAADPAVIIDGCNLSIAQWRNVAVPGLANWRTVDLLFEHGSPETG